MRRIIFIFIFITYSHSQTWDYRQFDRWPLECRLSKRQSPIAIEMDNVVFQRIPPVEFLHYDEEVIAAIHNTGKTIDITFEENPIQASIRGSFFQTDYTLENIHFHWDAEHTINGRRYPLEAHFVHYKTKAGNLSTALNFKDGVVVLAVFYQISELYNEVFDRITANIEEIAHQVNRIVLLDSPIVLKDLLPRNTRSFFSYQGSLTTPNCNEVVLWIVFANPSHLDQLQFDDLTDIYTAEDEPILANNRPLQDLNNREVLFSPGIRIREGNRRRRQRNNSRY